MKKHVLIGVMLCALPATGCGKIVAGIAKGAAHEGEAVAASAARASAAEEARIAASAAAHSADDGLHGPIAGAADDTTQHESTMGKLAAEALQEAGQQGLQSALTGNNDDDQH
ncbi:MAG: hypothetical protein QM773_13840 [Hyphomonadaceae bacterium]